MLARFAARPVWIHGALIAFGTFSIYVLGACRTIYVGDSGELVAAVATLGIPHPSGYPLYVLLGKLWTMWVPVGGIAFRMSLFSAAAAAAACGLFYGLLRRAGLAAISGLFATLLLAFGPSFWSQANIQRVYSLGAFFVVAVTAAALEWYRSRQIQWMVLAAFLAGLGTCNHTVMGVFGVAVGVFAVITEPALLKRPRQIFACIGAGLVGLVPYSYLLLRSRQDPRLDWGDPETFSRLVDVAVRRNFWDRSWVESPGDYLVVAFDFLQSLGPELMWGGTVLALSGAILGWQRGWPVLLPLLAMGANLWAVGTHGSRTDIFYWHRYYIPAYTMAALLAAYGCQWVVERWGRQRAVLTLAIPLVLFLSGYPKFDRSDYRIADDFSRTLLSTLPPGAHLAASDDNILFVLIYLHLVEGLRPDVDLIMQGVGDAELPALRFDPDTDPLFFTHHPNWAMADLDIVPVGLTFRTARSGTPLPEPRIPKTELDGENDPRVPKDYLTQNLIGHFHYMLGMTFETRDWRRAAKEFSKASVAAAENDVLFYNLGLIYRRNGLFRRSLEAFERSREINPRRIASHRPVQASDRIEELRREVERLATVEEALRDEPSLEGLTAGEVEFHRRMAQLLERQGESLAAVGHRLLAQEAS